MPQFHLRLLAGRDAACRPFAGRHTITYDARDLRVAHPDRASSERKPRDDCSRWQTEALQAPGGCGTQLGDFPAHVTQPAQCRSPLPFDLSPRVQGLPSTDSRQLLDLVNRLCDATDPVEAANLRNTLLLQLSAQGKLGGNQAVWPDGSRVPDWQNEIRQETAVKLLVRFAADALAFEDRGSYAAAAWLDMVCKNCRADAKQRYRESAAAVGTPRDPRDFERFAARLEAEHLRDVMERGIRGIADPQVQAAMFDYLDGIDIDASAERLGVCSRTVDRWRQQGREELRPFLAAELGRRE